MHTTASIPVTVPLETSRSASVPWYFKLLVFGATCIPVGALWDISWHSTIGRDTFWMPAHIVTYMGGLIPGLVCGWLALKTHFFGSAQERAAAVTFWGFRAPLGAWVCIWGSFMMLLSAPFDDWWHNTYGLDVQILSPPHAVLALGMFHVALGVLLQMASLQNRAEDTRGQFLFIFTGGIMLIMAAIFLTEWSFPNHQHGSRFYRASSVVYPLYLLTLARSSKLRWPATTAAAIYMTGTMLMTWLLPLFPAQPKLAPIYNPVDHMTSIPFPLLLVVPAFGIDVIMRLLGRRPGWLRDTGLAVVITIVFLALFMPAQWWFSKFMLTPAADNWFFAAGHWLPYSEQPGPWLHQFWGLDPESRYYNPLTIKQFGGIAVRAFIFARIGLSLGTW
ncbi:MAG TPA: hypothetical protein VK615_16060, partial [Candidatus Binatia bacterium]|nr:hypothetical protein [Candidatus Binatia bacterium]